MADVAGLWEDGGECRSKGQDNGSEQEVLCFTGSKWREMMRVFAHKRKAVEENRAGKPGRVPPRHSRDGHYVLQLQKRIGNQGVLRLLETGVLQPKVMIGQPGDRYEQEADRVADVVMGKYARHPGLSKTTSTTIAHTPDKQKPGKIFSNIGCDFSLLHLTKTMPIITRSREETGLEDSDESALPSPNRVCGPDVTSEVANVWTRMQREFNNWSDTNKLAACLYLILPFVPQRSTNPRSEGGEEYFRGRPRLPNPLNPNANWALNRDAFDTIGLFVGSAGWLLTIPGCGIPGCRRLSSGNFPRGHVDPCEANDTCTLTVPHVPLISF